MYWHWISAPPIVLIGMAWVMSSPLLQNERVSDELERVISLLVPIVAALLSPLVAAIVLLFRQLVAEMRANREMSERLGRVVQANTLSSDANTHANNRVADTVSALETRITQIEQERMRDPKRRLPT
jgi:hypothetical protein